MRRGASLDKPRAPPQLTGRPGLRNALEEIKKCHVTSTASLEWTVNESQRDVRAHIIVACYDTVAHSDGHIERQRVIV